MPPILILFSQAFTFVVRTELFLIFLLYLGLESGLSPRLSVSTRKPNRAMAWLRHVWCRSVCPYH